MTKQSTLCDSCAEHDCAIPPSATIAICGDYKPPFTVEDRAVLAVLVRRGLIATGALAAQRVDDGHNATKVLDEATAGQRLLRLIEEDRCDA